MRNKKGFTLVELLAVIVVLGIIMAIAAGTVTRTISNARKNSFINSHKMLTKEIKTRIQKNNLGIDIQPVECDESAPNPDDKCSKVYDISDKDYKMVVKINDSNNYIFTLEGIGSFAGVDLNGAIDNAYEGSLNAKDSSDDFPSVTSYVSASGKTIDISGYNDYKKQIELGRRINFAIHDIKNNFKAGSNYYVEGSGSYSNDSNTYGFVNEKNISDEKKIKYNIHQIYDSNTGNSSIPTNVPNIASKWFPTSYQGNAYLITLSSDDTIGGFGENYFISVGGISNTKEMNFILLKLGLMVDGVCYHPDLYIKGGVNYYRQYFILDIYNDENGEEIREFKNINWYYCNKYEGYSNSLFQ